MIAFFASASHPHTQMKSASFYNFCRKELAESLNRAGFESYRAEQLFRAVYKENAADFSNKFIPHLLKTHAEGTFDLALPGKIKEEAVSKLDRTVKVLLELDSPKYSVECKGNVMEMLFN